MTSKFNWFYQPNLVMWEWGNSVSKMEKVGLVFYTVPYSFYYKRVSVFLLCFPSLLHSWKSMTKFHFLRSVLQNRRSRMFTQENTCVGVSFNKVANQKSCRFIKKGLLNICEIFKNTFFSQNTSGGCFCNFQVNDFIFSF